MAYKNKIFNHIIKSIVIGLLIIALIYIIYDIICKQYIYPIKYEEYVVEAAEENNIDPYLIFAIIKQESKFDKTVCSNKGAKGLMQLLDSTASEIAQDIECIDENSIDLFDAKTNIFIGAKYFKTLVDRYNGNIKLAICAYNAGLGNVDRWQTVESIYSNFNVHISNIPFEETKTYLINVLKFYNKYVELYN